MFLMMYFIGNKLLVGMFNSSAFSKSIYNQNMLFFVRSTERNVEVRIEKYSKKSKFLFLV